MFTGSLVDASDCTGQAYMVVACQLELNIFVPESCLVGAQQGV